MTSLEILLSGMLFGTWVGIYIHFKVMKDQKFLKYLADKYPERVKTYRLIEEEEK